MYRSLCAYTLALLAVPALAQTALPQSLPVQFVDARTGAALEGVVVTSASAPAAGVGEAEMSQKNRQFVPHTLVVAKGSNVDFPNLDNTQHHVYSFSKAKPFNIELYAGKPESPVLFDKAGIVELGCNIHDQMKGFVLVTDNHQWQLSDAQGQVNLDESWLEAGVLDVWHPRLKDNTRTLTLQAAAISGPVKLALMPEPEAPAPLSNLQKRFQNIR
ncbi:methylamine utilization protein [Hydrocarboniclastica marina]|mgnify:CR=1 FL=1|uniref:Methylamine utilization protein n=1 Tax=Hydrocarboniclastica marina TaxID=2259620 RepID=A0A4P7XLR9_9ALTE|nr:methylamine utilization protein [Hydrocarboniclastica marina]MAM00184.1 methylamine utilization protein [Alteromonadaceae bacterium]QCF27524.1 methylamine utilization protein [Hydrocarboniclastica marina]